VLSGIGTIGNTTIASGGAFMPDNAVPGASTRVAGDLALQSGVLWCSSAPPRPPSPM
jgi:hypothetical protein